jgi:hypothetical protein
MAGFLFMRFLGLRLADGRSARANRRLSGGALAASPRKQPRLNASYARSARARGRLDDQRETVSATDRGRASQMLGKRSDQPPQLPKMLVALCTSCRLREGPKNASIHAG